MSAHRAYLVSDYLMFSAACAAPVPYQAPVHIDEWLANDKALHEHLSSLAVDEAQMILADAEPELVDPAAAAAGEYVPWTEYTSQPNIYPCRQALAESLERWLESMEVL